MRSLRCAHPLAFCERELAGYELVNREQDLGEPGQRRAKKTYRLHHFVVKHRLPF